MKTLIIFLLAIMAGNASATDCDAAKKEARSYCDAVFVEEDMNASCVAEIIKSEYPECEAKK